MMTAHAEVILDALKKRGDAILSRPFPDHEFQASFALAQHHGIPTRFLDWTESPLVAAFFAAYKAVFEAEHFASLNESERFVCILYFYPGNLERNEAGLELILAPRAQNRFLLVQKGIFTNPTQANRFFFEHGRWPSVEDTFDLAKGHQFLYQARLPQSEAAQLLRLLYHLGVTRQSVAPSLSNCATAYQYASTLFGRHSS